MEITKINPTTILFDEGGVRFFLLIGSQSALLIDSGMNTKDAKEIAMQYTSLPIELICTHTDRDHIGSNHEFTSLYLHPSELVNYTPDYANAQSIKPVYDGDILDLGNRFVKIIHIPGHTPGSIGILDIQNKMLFSGDGIQKDGNIFMFGPMRNFKAYYLGLLHLKKYADEINDIYPSHGIYPLNMAIVEEIMAAVKENKITSQEKTNLHGHDLLRVKIGPSYFLLADEN